MPSELLVETIAMLRQRIHIRSRYLGRNETPTRQLLVDPLLQALGWDFKDSGRVTLEKNAGEGWADYVLLSDERPRIVVEAKRFGTSLTNEVVNQAVRYALWLGVRHVAITDGDEWRVFEIVDVAERSLKLTTEFKVTGLELSETAANANLMSRDAILNGSFSVTSVDESM